MAFDACMMVSALSEIKKTALGARIEKVYQPERDEIVLQMRSLEGGKRLQINAGSGNPRIGFTEINKENPQNPPMFCMLLRKHLQGAKLSEVSYAEFDRIAYLGFDTRDEMGFPCKKYLIAELMGRYSNLIFADESKKIISAMRTADLSFDSMRQLVTGMAYAEPPKQDKLNPLVAAQEDFYKLFDAAPAERQCDKFIVGAFSGVAPVVAREIVYRATGHTDTPVKYCFKDDVYREFSLVMDRVRNEDFAPCIILDGERPVEYSFMPLLQYGKLECRPMESVGKLFDTYFEARDREQRVHQRASDILKLLTNAEGRIRRKLEAQRGELADCEKGSEYKKMGDLITANIYRLSRGDRIVEFDDYEDMREDGSFGKIKVELDNRLSPAANAQRYYKRYNKAKNARVELAKQIELGEAELNYIYTVFESLTRAESPSDLTEIRDELYQSGYASRMKSYSAHKAHAPTVAQFETPDGMRILCGKNNTQNEYITHKLAAKHDYWFHAKQTPGSHVLLVTDGKEPTDLDFTTAAEIAAYYSKAEGDNIAVDYTLAKNVKKPAGAKPGFVIYHTNWTAYVTPNGEKISSLRRGK
ncbi:MAG: fibronectin/fibrinogen-binding protein [Ruminococcaceae bacterium]|nr:fibronectin/fibrinogen-binding protein [Oscillospiraceae bacterium]